MRFSENRPEDLARARTAAREWRERNPQGTAEQLIANIGSQFHPDYGTVLRGILFAIDSHGSKITTGISIVEFR
jgi:hypothetical protein